MPVINVQRKMRQLGTVRLGFSTPGSRGGKRPNRSKTIILTSPDKWALEHAAAQFGGTVTDFPEGSVDKFKLITERTEIPIAVTSIEASQWREHWDKGSCVLRCNGEEICGPRKSPMLGKPCHCKKIYPDDSERYEAAKVNKACKLVTRFSFMIPSVPDIGVWRLDTRGEHAAEELPLTVEFIQSALGEGRMYVPCTLAIEQRKNTDGQPYPVPVVRLTQSMQEIEAARLTAPTPQQLATGTQKQLEAPDDDGDHIDTTFNSDDPEGVFRNEEE